MENFKWQRVASWRDAGVRAKWGRMQNGRPAMFVRLTDNGPWWLVDAAMVRRVNECRAAGESVADAVRDCTMLGDFFSIPA